MSVFLWSKNATEFFKFKLKSIIAIKGARVSNYFGIVLNSGDEHSKLLTDPDTERTTLLKIWAIKDNDKLNEIVVACSQSEKIEENDS